MLPQSFSPLFKLVFCSSQLQEQAACSPASCVADKARELDFHTRFIELASEINENMPYHVVLRIMYSLNTQCKSLKNAKVLGAAYKKDIEEYFSEVHDNLRMAKIPKS